MVPSMSTARMSPIAWRSRRALLLREGGLDPVGALGAFGRIHLVRQEPLHLREGELAAAVLGHSVDGLLHRLVPLPQSHPDGAAGRLEARALEGGDDRLLLRRRRAAALGLLVCGLEAEEGLRHVVRGIDGRQAVALLVRGAEPAIQLVVGSEDAVGAAGTDDGAVGDLACELVRRRLARREQRGALLEEAPR